ncbi:hypothetical protein CcCBS67573_g05425 [Chytriomyces confervae]|uniref:Major facilitator superfamily (MFS) profile domain-containing protein n=1 Tax=Chytriomyces confervae TaxID=246404 RepID=A0A507FDE6_9FUNG|nr:hypothetical protein HDU80_004735 [Chytriomyces hyalinus]TPX73298.1 hypothetical protein CcCBS67573_g05425 [Chytriomyces confervae]
MTAASDLDTSKHYLAAVTAAERDSDFNMISHEVQDPAPKENESTTARIDGGFDAWMVVAAGFIAHFVIFGLVYSFGVFFAYYTKEGLGSSSSVAFIGSTGTVFIPGLGILSGRLAQQYGFRRLILIGSLLLSLGIFAASFVPDSLPLLICTQGALFGIGASLVYFPALSLPSQWFSKHRGLATGLAASGAGLGGMVFSLAVDRLITAVGIHWTLRVSAIVSCVLLLAATPFFKTRIATTKSKIDYSVVKDPRFMCLLLSCFLSNFAMFVCVDFLAVYAQEVAGLSLSNGATLLAVYNTCSTVGRIFTGLAADRWLGPTNALVISSWITATSNFAWLRCTDLPSLCVFAGVTGFFGGAFWGLLPVVVAELFGADGKMVSIVGVLYTLLAGGNFGSPPLTGWIKEHWGLWWMVVYAGCLACLSGVAATSARFLHSRELLKKV